MKYKTKKNPKKSTTAWHDDDTDLNAAIDRLIKPYKLDHSETLREMIKSLIKMFDSPHDMHDVQQIRTTLEETRQAYKVFLPHRDTLKVSIFGSARTKPGETDYKMAETFARKITARGLMVITGAGPGVMEAGNKGAAANMSFGVNINLPFEQEPNRYIKDDPKLVGFNYFFNRKVAFVKESDATVIFPGGYGTHDECFELLTLIQTGRTMPKPIVLMAHPGSQYWRRWHDFVKKALLKPGYISEDDLTLYALRYNVDEAIEYIMSFYRIYHSIRYTKEFTIMRLNRVPTEKNLRLINQEFKDILFNGEFKIVPLSQLTCDNENYPDKIRMVFNFNKKSFGRLCKMILFLNHIDF